MCGQDPLATGRTVITAGVGILVGSVLASSASAQEAGIDSPESLVETAQPIGMQVGAFQVFPRITADLRFDDNIYNRSSDRVEDVAAVVRPSLSIRPDLTRHDLRLDVGAEVRRYFDTVAENTEQYAVSLAGRADLPERTTATGRIGFARRIERRGTAGDAFLTDEPVSYVERGASLGLARTGGLLELSGELSAVESTYDDASLGGVPIDQSFRDTLRLRGSLRASYQIGPRIAGFVQASANDLDYRLEPDGPRGSSGYSFLGGVRFDLGDLASGEAAIGYLRQGFASPTEEAFSGIDFYVSAQWTPLPRLRLAAEGSRSVERSPLPQVPAVIESGVRVSALYALGSRILTGLELGYVSESYSAIDRSEHRYFGEASLQYQLNPHLAAFTAAGYRKQSSQGPEARDYDGATVRIGVRWTP